MNCPSCENCETCGVEASKGDVRIVATYPGREVQDGVQCKEFLIPYERYYGKRTKTHRSPIEDIGYTDYAEADLVIVIDPDGKTAVVKNRYGHMGVVAPFEARD